MNISPVGYQTNVVRAQSLNFQANPIPMKGAKEMLTEEAGKRVSLLMAELAAIGVAGKALVNLHKVNPVTDQNLSQNDQSEVIENTLAKIPEPDADKLEELRKRITSYYNDVRNGNKAGERFYQQTATFMLNDDSVQGLIHNNVIENGGTDSEYAELNKKWKSNIENGSSDEILTTYIELIDKTFNNKGVDLDVLVNACNSLIDLSHRLYDEGKITCAQENKIISTVDEFKAKYIESQKDMQKWD